MSALRQLNCVFANGPKFPVEVRVIRNRAGVASRQACHHERRLCCDARNRHFRRLVRSVVLLGTTAAAAALIGSVACAAPHAPLSDDVVLQRSGGRQQKGIDRELQELRQKLARNPIDIELALSVARRHIAQSKVQGEPRFLGYAEAALGPWWTLPQPTVDVLVLRATIRQSNHDFDSALGDLRSVLRQQPRNAQAWVLCATIHQVRGEYEEARAACLNVARFAPGLVAVTCSASLAAITGSAESARRQLAQQLELETDADADVRRWAWPVLAEIDWQIGRASEAEKHFKQALAIGTADVQVLAAYANFLFDQGRPQEVMKLLEDEDCKDALLLWRALASHKLAPNSPGTRRLVEQLRDAFAVARRRGDAVHDREEAIFELQISGDPRRALKLATDNWRIQREVSDARILLEAALACDDGEAAATVLRWLEKNRIEHVRLTPLAARFRNLAVQNGRD